MRHRWPFTGPSLPGWPPQSRTRQRRSRRGRAVWTCGADRRNARSALTHGTRCYGCDVRRRIMVITMSPGSQPILQHSRLSRAEALAREIEAEISAGVLATGDRLGTKDDLRRRVKGAGATPDEGGTLLGDPRLGRARPPA